MTQRGGDDYVTGPDGEPLRDRYGRPVRRRGTPPPPRNTPFAGETRPGQRPAQRPAQRSAQRSAQRPPLRQSPPDSYRLPPEPTRFDLPRQQAAPSRQQAAPSRLEEDLYSVPRSYRPPGASRSKALRGVRGLVSRFGCLGCIGWPLAIILVLTLVLTLWTDGRLTRVDATPPTKVNNTAGTNWLLVGSDSRQGLSDKDIERLGTGGDVGVGRTDTIMILHIPKKGKAQLVSVPRDSYVSIPGFGEDKINAAFTYGGPELLTQTLEQETGLRIDHYAEVGMGGLASVVDAVGGVNMCLDEPIDDPLAGISLQAGCQDMKGPEALGYVRTRATAQGDLDRVQRQREFFAALLDKVTKPSTLLNPIKFVSLVNNTASSFIVGEGDHVWHLARVALAMRSGVETKTVPLGGFADTAVGSVILWDEEQTAALWESMK